MGFFSKRQAAGGALIPPVVLGQLRDFGAAALDARARGAQVTDARFGWEAFLGPAMMAMQSDVPRAVREIYTAAGGEPMATFGGYRVLAEYSGDLDDPLFVEMMDTSVDLMKSRRFSSGHLTGYESSRWIQTHGDLRTSFHGIVEVEVPAPGAAVPLDLDLGATMKIAAMGPDPLDNSFHIERLHEGYQVFSMRVHEAGDASQVRCEEPTIGTSDSLDEAFRRIGRYLRVRPYWVVDALDPYLPDRRL